MMTTSQSIFSPVSIVHEREIKQVRFDTALSHKGSTEIRKESALRTHSTSHMKGCQHQEHRRHLRIISFGLLINGGYKDLNRWEVIRWENTSKNKNSTQKRDWEFGPSLDRHLG